jgi:hypothetical protein
MLIISKKSHLKISSFLIVVCLIYVSVDTFSQAGYDNQHYSYSINVNEGDGDISVCPSSLTKNLPDKIRIVDNVTPASYIAVSYFLEAKETLRIILFLTSKATFRAPPSLHSI